MKRLSVLLFGLIFAISAPLISSASEPVCPSDFKPDDPSWVMVMLTGFGEESDKYVDSVGKTWQVWLGHKMVVRAFRYEPDPAFRLIKPIFSEECFGEVLSYRFGPHEKRVQKMFRTGSDTIYFLEDESGVWRRGSETVHIWDHTTDPVNPTKVLILLDENNKWIATRRVPY